MRLDVSMLCTMLAATSLAACDLQPPPKSKPRETLATTEPPKQPGNIGRPVTMEECLAVGEHFAQVLIDTATDPAERAILEQEKTRNVRRQGETCQVNNWDEATRSCFLRATTRPALQACITAASPPPKQPTPEEAAAAARAADTASSEVVRRAGSAAAGSAAGAEGSAAVRAGQPRRQ